MLPSTGGGQNRLRRDKRSRLVCVHCHEKKIRCDLQQNPSHPCSKCVDAGTDCRIRQSKRLKSARSALAKRLDDGPSVIGSHELSLQIQTGVTVPPLVPCVASMHSANQQGFQSLPEEPPLRSAIAGPDDIAMNSGISCQQDGHSATPYASSAADIGTVASYLGESSFLQIFSGYGAQDVLERSNAAQTSSGQYAELPPPALQQSYLDTYYKHCYTWCPILDPPESDGTTLLNNSPLLLYALALMGSHIEPPVMPHASPAQYYKRAKALFYSNSEKNPLVAISAIMLFYWWGYAPPDIVSIDTVWWWTGVAIRQAQQLGLHREPRPGQVGLLGETPSLRRRIWWTLFARERLTSICMDRPCMIDPMDCNVAELTLEDFPESQRDSAELFIYWVRLCAIVGLVSQHLSRKSESTPFPIHLASKLKEWTQSLPPHLQLPISNTRTTNFRAEVHQLHITYLTLVTILYLSDASRALPIAYKAAVLASCCVARIFEDFTARCSMRFLHGMTGWSIAIAILALLHARKVQRLTEAADAHICILRIALKEMGKLWHSSRMFDRGFERIDAVKATLRPSPECVPDSLSRLSPSLNSPIPELSDHSGSGAIEWKDYFPYLTPETSPLAAILLEPMPDTPLLGLGWPVDLTLQLQGFFDPLGNMGGSLLG